MVLNYQSCVPDMGFYMDVVGNCPLCKREVVRNKYGYGCTGYKDGCNFKVSGVICGRVISAANVKLLLSNGETAQINGFISKNNKEFNAKLRLKDGKAVFEF